MDAWKRELFMSSHFANENRTIIEAGAQSNVLTSSAARRLCRRCGRAAFLTAAAVVAATMAACGADAPCIETATCPPLGGDAQPDRNVSDADAGTASDGSSADGSAPSDAGSPGDRADRAETPPDRSAPPDAGTGRDADGGRPSDSSVSSDRSADHADGGAISTPDAAMDAAPDVPVCDPDAGRSPAENPCIVSDRYGVFVSPAGSDTTGVGTRGAPFRTIMRGLRAAKPESARVFVCDDGTGYTDPIALDPTLDGVTIHGGFECAGWTLPANQRTRIHPPAGPALSIGNLTAGATLDRFELVAADAAPGASSIAVIIQTSMHVVLRNSRLVSGKGGAGSAGIDGAPGKDGDPVGPAQRGLPAIPSIGWAQSGGIAVAGACGSKGGNGGGYDANTTEWQPGQSGAPMVNVTPPNVENGATDPVHLINGLPGSTGDRGAVGAVNPKGGTFSVAGYAPAATAGAGSDGFPGQGGGGGASNLGSSGFLGATGGAGGMGGCGGRAGTGGGGGGASVALLSWTSGVTLEGCEVVSADGGAGGKGGQGGVGGKGSDGAEGGDGFNEDAGVTLDRGGLGGPGGAGGSGGPGAGGNGGPSYAIVYAGGRPAQIGGTTVLRGNGGAPGAGGGVGSTTTRDGGTIPDDGGQDSGAIDAGADGGTGFRAPDGLPGEAAYELAIP